ncbi:MAG: hypothetical protein ACOYLE_09945 [Bacteroidales bacterium]
MKTIKFIFFFNLFFYSSMLLTILFVSLFVYRIEMHELKLILLKFFNAFPVIFGVVNITLLLILAFEALSKWADSQLKNIDFTEKKRKSMFSPNNFSLNS